MTHCMSTVLLCVVFICSGIRRAYSVYIVITLHPPTGRKTVTMTVTRHLTCLKCNNINGTFNIELCFSSYITHKLWRRHWHFNNFKSTIQKYSIAFLFVFVATKLSTKRNTLSQTFYWRIILQSSLFIFHFYVWFVVSDVRHLHIYNHIILRSI